MNRPKIIMPCPFCGIDKTDIKKIYKIQMLVSFGVLILSLGSCSREYRIGRLQDRVEMLEHENSVLETMVHNLEDRTEDNEK